MLREHINFSRSNAKSMGYATDTGAIFDGSDARSLTICFNLQIVAIEHIRNVDNFIGGIVIVQLYNYVQEYCVVYIIDIDLSLSSARFLSGCLSLSAILSVDMSVYAPVWYCICIPPLPQLHADIYIQSLVCVCVSGKLDV